MRKTVILTIVMTFSAACTAAAGGRFAAPPTSGSDTPAARGAAFARAHCAACHAVEPGFSPKPEAPTFEAIANARGLTIDTLRPWLRDSHNFPEVMNFAIAPEQVDDLAAHILTLKSPDYRPPIQ
ncbi:c-type cytochrome [Sphingobium olei]|uniref:C-type cytochrome n=1 Tax=Sphingobium olei TaxID=420955 RepID=A0ABW3NZ94_9SPHN